MCNTVPTLEEIFMCCHERENVRARDRVCVSGAARVSLGIMCFHSVLVKITYTVYTTHLEGNILYDCSAMNGNARDYEK